MTPASDAPGMPTDRGDRLRAALAPQYVVERELGGGGMSRVFVAEETALGRRVVIKVLAPDLAHDLAAERFAREIRVAANLQQANIVPVLSAGVADGLPYYTMPLVDGRSLRERLASTTGALATPEAIGILRDVARALEHAHARGLVHRDIKPENVLLSGGAAVVTDFGIAKALDVSRTAPGATLTNAGTALGTPAYMAPEQAVGDDVDSRADIYAWGVVAYELLAGVHPFAGKTSTQQLVAAHLSESPSPLSTRAPSVSLEIAALVMRCLEKDRARRPASATELLARLDAVVPPSTGTSHATDRRRIGIEVAAIAGVALVIAGGLYALRARASAPVGSARTRTIAVLAFENGTRDTSADYVADGVGDEIRSALADVPGVSVKARRSSMRFRGRSAEAQAIGATLGVDAVVSGVVRRGAERVQVAAELEDATNGNALWSRTFEVPMRDLPSLADSVAHAIAERLGVGAGASLAARKRDESRETHDAVAYDAFLQGKLAFEQFDFERATRLFGLAVERDPSFARAHAWLAMAHANRANTGTGSQDSALAQARASSARALSLDSTLIPARLADAIVLQTLLRFREAEAAFQDIVATDSNDAEVRINRSILYYEIGRLPEALREADASLRNDPLNAIVHVTRQNVLYLQRRYDESLQAVNRVLALDPSNVVAHLNRANVFVFTGLADSAVAEAERASRIDSTGFGARSTLAFAYAAANRWRDVDRLRAVAAADRRYNSPQYERAIFALIDGDDDAAMTALERALEHHEPLLYGLSLTCDPIFDPLHGHPRFIALAQRYEMGVCQPKGRWPIAKPPGSARSSS